jgi:hypothetical protein
MTGLAILAASLILVMASCELVLQGTRLQTGLARVLVVWAACYVPTAWLLWTYGETGPVAFTIFWGGAFLSWFGVRSHIESSILLRMLYLLRKRPLTETELIGAYTARYGESVRLEELFRGGLASRSGETLLVTAKGKAILRVVSRLAS